MKTLINFVFALCLAVLIHAATATDDGLSHDASAGQSLAPGDSFIFSADQAFSSSHDHEETERMNARYTTTSLPRPKPGSARNWSLSAGCSGQGYIIWCGISSTRCVAKTAKITIASVLVRPSSAGTPLSRTRMPTSSSLLSCYQCRNKAYLGGKLLT